MHATQGTLKGRAGSFCLVSLSAVLLNAEVQWFMTETAMSVSSI